MLSLMRAISLLPTFLDTYSVSTSSLWCRALIIVINFLVLSSICLLLSILTTVLSILQELLRCLYLRCTFCCRTWFREVFSFFWSTHLLFFSFIFNCSMASASNILKYLSFSFSLAFRFFLDLAVQFLPLFIFQLFLKSTAYFLMPNSILGCIILLFVSESPILFYFL